MKVIDVIEHLKRNHKPNDEVAYMLYSRLDVTMYLQTNQGFTGYELTETEKDEVLCIMNRHQDCENGMTWLSMDNAIEDVITERERK